VPGVPMLPASLNPYVYALNNPVLYTDPSGEFIVPLLLAIGVGAAIGGVGGGVGYALAHPGGRPEDYLRDAGFQRAVGVGALSGAVAGGVGFGVGGLVAGLPGLGGAVLGGALTGAAASGTGQVTTNLMTPCVKWNTGLGRAMFWGGVTGGIAGGVGYGIRQWRLSTVARLRDAATRANRTVPGSGAVVGTRRHTVFQEIVDSWNDPRLGTEASYYGRRPAPYRGYPGSIRLDVVEYDATGNIIAIYDYKTGNATLTAARIAQIRAYLPLDAQNVPIIVIRGR
jgi:hypothetical protein